MNDPPRPPSTPDSTPGHPDLAIYVCGLFSAAMSIVIDPTVFWERLSKLHKGWLVRSPNPAFCTPSDCSA